MSPRSLAELIRSAPGRVGVTTFASNVARIRAVAEAAAACGREVVLVGRAMERVAQVARETGYLDDIREFRSLDTYGYLPPDKVVALCTGSQGEPRAALARIAEDQHPLVTFSRGDRVIFSSRAIPGNEKAVMRIINGLVSQGVEVITDRTHLVHVSGHPRRAELEEMISLGAAADPHPGARRAAASGRARRARAPRRRRQGRDLPQRRPGAARARRPGDHRRGAGRPPLQGRLAAGRRRASAPCRTAAGSASPASSRWRWR